MPTYVYKCNDCETKYEIFHKVQEKEEDVLCPSCNSKSAIKQMSAAFIGSSSSSQSIPSMGSTCACGNDPSMCGMN